MARTTVTLKINLGRAGEASIADLEHLYKHWNENCERCRTAYRQYVSSVGVYGTGGFGHRASDELSWRGFKKGYRKHVRPGLRRVARGTGRLVTKGGRWTYRRL